MHRSASIYDVAKAAGVAPSTVSRAFSRPGRVNALTAERIFAAAKVVGYRTAVLPGLVGQRTHHAALRADDGFDERVVPRLDSAYLARLVVEHRLDEDEAAETVTDLVTSIPRRVFKL